MRKKKEANRYDKIFKENLESVTLALIEKVLRIEVASYEKIPADLQRTLERKPDQLLKIIDQRGHTFLLHLEFQLSDEPLMAERMLEYRALLKRKFGITVRQYVLFLSDQQPSMSTRIEEANLSFAFELIRLSQVNYGLFLSSARGDEVVFAVLGNFGNTEPEQAASQIIQRLEQTSASASELDKHLEQLRILANLRKLNPFIEQIMESIAKYIKPEDDFFFKKGAERGAEQKTRETILKFLRDGILTTPQLASYFEVSEDFVENLRNQLNQTK